MVDLDNVARICLVIGFVLTAITTGSLFFTSHWTSICIVDALDQQPIDKAELNRCITTPAYIDGMLLIGNIIGFIALTYSSAITLRKKSKHRDSKTTDLDWSIYTKKTRDFLKLTKYVAIAALLLGISIMLIPEFLIPYKDRLVAMIAAMGVATTVLIAITTMHYQNKKLQVTSMTKIFELLSSSEIRKARQEVHKEYCRTKEIGTISFRNTDDPKMPEYVDKVMSAFDQVSVLVLNRLVDEDLIFDAYGAMIVRDWNTLVIEINMRRIKNKRIARHFEELKNRYSKRIDDENKELADNEKTHTEPYCEKDED